MMKPCLAFPATVTQVEACHTDNRSTKNDTYYLEAISVLALSSARRVPAMHDAFVSLLRILGIALVCLRRNAFCLRPVWVFQSRDFIDYPAHKVRIL